MNFLFRLPIRTQRVRCSSHVRFERKEKKERTDTNTNAFIPTVHARKQVYLSYSVAWRSRSFAISFLRKRRGTVLAGRGWSFLRSFLPFFIPPSFISSFLPFFLSSFVRFRWRTRAGYTFRSAEVKREIRGGI